MLSEFELPVSRRWVTEIRSYASLGTILQLLAVTVAVGLLLYRLPLLRDERASPSSSREVSPATMSMGN